MAIDWIDVNTEMPTKNMAKVRIKGYWANTMNKEKFQSKCLVRVYEHGYSRFLHGDGSAVTHWAYIERPKG